MDALKLIKELQKMVIWEVGNVTPYDKGFAAGVDRAIEIILKSAEPVQTNKSGVADDK